ncbi:protein of unknown function [Rhodovastum atsumiense]|nr:protein of unknown function [Rhodovastum atsumiense]
MITVCPVGLSQAPGYASLPALSGRERGSSTPTSPRRKASLYPRPAALRAGGAFLFWLEDPGDGEAAIAMAPHYPGSVNCPGSY